MTHQNAGSQEDAKRDKDGQIQPDNANHSIVYGEILDALSDREI